MKRYSYDEFKKIADGEGLDLLTPKIEYKNVGTKCTFKCKKCGNIIITQAETILESIRKGYKRHCKKCIGREDALDSSVFEKRFNKLAGDKFELMSKYTTSKIPIKVKCKKCGREFNIFPFDSLKNGCKYCVNNVKFTDEEFKQKVKQEFGDEFTILEKYKGNHKKIAIKHNICGRVFYNTPEHLFMEKICPLCEESTGQIEIYDFVKNLCSDAVLNARKVLSERREIDIYVPSKKIGIEYDGLYWYSEKVRGKNYQLDKLRDANKKGIRLITIFEDEYKEHKDLVLDKLSYILGKSTSERKIYGRKCVVKEISSKEKNDFLNANHIQRTVKSQYNIGAFFNEELVSVMALSKPRLGIGKSVGEKDIYEIERFASKVGCLVLGTFGKILDFFKKKYSPKKIYTFADLRWVDLNSNIYKASGFKLEKINRPNYWYFRSAERFHRFEFRKSQIKIKFPDIYDKNLTEFQMMDKTKYGRDWDCGTAKYSIDFTNIK